MTKSIPKPPRNNNVSDPAHTVTILTCTGDNFAAKTHRRTANGSLITDQFNAGMYFDHEEVGFDGIGDLYETVVEAASDPKKLFIRGRLRADAPQRSDGRVRRCNRKQSDGEEPYFEDADRAWAMLDFDKLENPNGLAPASAEAMEYLRSLLPPEFHDVECIYSLSASAGMSDSDRISGHLWFVFDRPVSNLELKVWLSGYPADKRLFQCVHAHYIASPVFRDGLVDPVDERNGLLPGQSSIVSVPDIDTSKPAYEYRGDGRGLEAARGYEAKMALLGDGNGREGCHAVITSAIASYMTRHGHQADREALKADIRLCAVAAPWDSSKHPEAYVAHEVSDEVMDRSIQDWVDKTIMQADGYALLELDDVEVAREKVKQTVDRFVSTTIQWQEQHDYRQELIKKGSLGFFKIDKQYVYDLSPLPRYGLAAQVALGKTEAYISRVLCLLPFLQKEHCIFIGVPNHSLSEEIIQRLRELGIGAEVYLGPAQPDPDQPGKKMCQVDALFMVFQAAGIAGELCKGCEHSSVCGFQKQKTKKSLVWIGADHLLYRRRLRPIPPVDFVIIDEDPLPAGLEGANPKQPKLLLGSDVPVDVAKAIEQLPLGQPFSRDEFAVTDRRLHELERLTYAQMHKVGLGEFASEQAVQEALAMAKENNALVAKASFFRAIAGDGPWGMRCYDVPGVGKLLKWIRQRKIHSDFDVPTLFADATLNEVAIEHIIDVERPPADVEEAWVDEDGSIVPAMDQRQPFIMGPAVKVSAKTPHATYRQVLFSGAAAQFKGDGTGANNVARVRRYIEGRSSAFNSALVICQQELEEKLCDLGLPPNVQTAHLNAIRGQNKWKDVDLLIVIGRTQPSPGAVELQAEALFRTPIKTLGPDYYDSVWTPLTGTDVSVPTERHPDKFAEIIRWHACEAELIQAIGRVRAVNRTAENPVQIDIINKVPLPDIKIDEVVEWGGAQPDPGAVIAGRYGVAFADETAKGVANVVAALLPDLFGTANAAKKAEVYSRCQTPNNIYLLGDPHREYTRGPEPTSAPLIALKAPGCRYAVLARPLRPPPRRALEKGEPPPKEADCNDDGVLSYGPVYILKNIPRRLKSKLL